MNSDIPNFVVRRKTCRLCGSAELELVMPIKPSPIGDAYVSAEMKERPQPLLPLDLYQCRMCGHVQNLDIVNPELLFRDYIYSTSSSLGLVEHFRNYADDVAKKLDLHAGSFVVEMGSNDGTLLRFFKGKGMRVQGVDPALNIAGEATRSGIPTIPEFFGSELAARILRDGGPAKLMVANNVFAHADDLSDVTMGIATLLDHDGAFVFEVSYLLDIVDKYLFDTVYHEHLSYHSIDPLARFFAKHGLHLFDVEQVSTKGGSLRGFAQKTGGPWPEQPVVKAMMTNEAERGLHQAEIFRQYERRVLARKEAVLKFIAEARAKGKKLVGYGASTTVATLMYHFELEDKLSYLIDDNPKKQGLYSPGCHLEVKSSSVLYEERPDVILILAWQYADPIISRHAGFIENGGQFVIPLPDLKIVGK